MANNALKWIIKEAKSLKRKYPKRFKKWTEYVAQASAIYAGKHKGKSPVGKKKRSIKVKRVAKKHTTRRKKIGNYVGGSADQPYLRTGAAGNKILSGIGHHHSVSNQNEQILHDLRRENNALRSAETRLKTLEDGIKFLKPGMTKNAMKVRKRSLKKWIATIKKTITAKKALLK